MLSLARLKEVYRYEPDTGRFIRLVASRSHGGLAKVGDVAGCDSGERYLRIGIDGRVYRAHRLAFLYMTGEWPKSGVDHKDLNPKNNRWENLRAADQSQNLANVGLRSDNTSGFKGVSAIKDGRWEAAIWVRGNKVWLGAFDDIAAAAAAYRQASQKHFGEFSRAA